MAPASVLRASACSVDYDTGASKRSKGLVLRCWGPQNRNLGSKLRLGMVCPLSMKVYVGLSGRVSPSGAMVQHDGPNSVILTPNGESLPLRPT